MHEYEYIMLWVPTYISPYNQCRMVAVDKTFQNANACDTWICSFKENTPPDVQGFIFGTDKPDLQSRRVKCSVKNLLPKCNVVEEL